MSQDEFSAELILEGIETAMSIPKQPKVLLFDIGGVCVVSPFQAILDYELTHQIPPGWINHSISKTSPNGSWHKLERGEILMDATFFDGFNQDLRDPRRWEDYYTLSKQREGIPVTQIPAIPEIDGKWLFFEMMRASREPDPWMLPALKNLKASGRYLMAALSNTVIFPPDHEYSKSQFGGDVKSIFDVFVSSAHVGLRKPDSQIYKMALAEVNKFAKENSSTRGRDLGWSEGVKPNEIIFLDDIGENLKAAKNAGFGTIKVHLGKGYDAVAALEKVTGLQLAGNHPVPKSKL